MVAIGVLVDANVLFSRTLRDWLFLLKIGSEADMFTVHASQDIIAEVLYRLRRTYPNAPGRLTSGVHDRIVENLDNRVSDFEVDGSYPGDDPDDAHVHAAAIACGAQILLTGDVGFTGLPDDLADQLPYEVHTPDSFFVLVDDSAPFVVETVTAEQHAYWSSKPGHSDLVSMLLKAQCPQFAERIRQHLDSLGLGR